MRFIHNHQSDVIEIQNLSLKRLFSVQPSQQNTCNHSEQAFSFTALSITLFSTPNHAASAQSVRTIPPDA